MARSLLKLAFALALAAPFGVAAQPSCVPAPFGTGTGFVVKSDSNARAFGWWCPQQFGAAKRVMYSGPLSAFVPDWESIAYSVARGSMSDVAAAHAKYATAVYPKNASGGDVIPFDQWPTFKAVSDSLAANAPAAPIWKVAGNPGFTTRPAFAYANGVRAATATARATVDAACYCDTRDVHGSTVYCAVNVARTWMSVCTRRN